LGDKAAIASLNTEVMRPLANAGPALTETLDAYLDSGGAIEACARTLFVHPNTVRYRLKRITDFTGRDPTSPRDAYVLRIAATVGRLARDHADAFTSEPGIAPVTINVIKA
jgi:DNA-binding PucR family transcriptional regulator